MTQRYDRLWERISADIKEEILAYRKGDKFTYELSDKALVVISDLDNARGEWKPPISAVE